MAAFQNQSNNSTEIEYFKQLNRILRTNTQRKSAKLLKKATGVHMSETLTENDFHCSLSKSIKHNKRCIESLNRVDENLASSFMAISESWKTRDNKTQDLIEATGKMMSMVVEAVSLSRKIHENSLGLHVVVDFLRNLRSDIKILDLSRTGRITVSHFSSNEAVTMCLTWLHTMAERLLNNLPTSSGSLTKMYAHFEKAVLYLRDSTKLSNEIFRVLLYCNSEGKEMLRKYAKGLQPAEKNDLITELQMLRRQFDLISILFERLGRSLTDVFARCTGDDLTFEALLEESQNGLKKRFKDEDLNQEVKASDNKKNTLTKKVKGKGIKNTPRKFKTLKKKVKKVDSGKQFLTKVEAVLGVRAEDESGDGDQA